MDGGWLFVTPRFVPRRDLLEDSVSERSVKL